VAAHRTLWFGLQYDSETVEQVETVGNGALATVRAWYDAGWRRSPRTVRGPKHVVGDMIDKGVLYAVDGETVPETEASLMGRRPTGAAHSDRRIPREGEPEPPIVGLLCGSYGFSGQKMVSP